MTEDEIIETLKIFNPLFKNKSVLELHQIMTFLTSQLKNNKKNWSIKLLDSFLKKNQIQIHTLKLFYTEYSRRKKSSKMFEKLLIDFNLKKENEFKKFLKTHGKSNDKIELIDKSRSSVAKFLENIKNLKAVFLMCNDDNLIEMISENINTGYSKSTLRNFYYNNYIDKKK